MQHKPPAKNINTVGVKPTNEQRRTKEVILQLAKAAVDKFGGYALIDEHYAFIDTRKFSVIPAPVKVSKVDAKETIPMAISEDDDGDDI